MTFELEPAMPKLQQAHRLLHEVREACHDETMEEQLGMALVATSDAQDRLRVIDVAARTAT